MDKDLIKLDEESNNIFNAIRKRRQNIMDKPTDKSYVKKKPTGTGTTLDYVPANYMDNAFKDSIPVYENHFAFPPFVFQNWIIVGIEVKDKISENVELGLAAHRIQFKADKKKAITGYYDEQKQWHAPTMNMGELTPFDMIDVSNDAKAALTDAIKNGQSRHGICSDIYQKNIVDPETLQEWQQEYNIIINQQYDILLSQNTNPMKQSKLQQEKKALIDQWNNFKGNKRELLNDIKEKFNIQINEEEQQN